MIRTKPKSKRKRLAQMHAAWLETQNRLPEELWHQGVIFKAKIDGVFERMVILEYYPEKREIQAKRDRPEYNAKLYYIPVLEAYKI